MTTTLMIDQVGVVVVVVETHMLVLALSSLLVLML